MKIGKFIKNRKIITLAFGLTLLVTGLLAGKLFLSNTGVTEVVYYPPAKIKPPAELHQPVYLRTGIAVLIKDKSFWLETDELDGPGREKINIIVTSAAEIIEIRVPNFITKAIEKELQAGGQAIKRVPVKFSNLKIGETVSVLSLTDTYGLKEITASRVEYQKFFDPTTQ